MWYFVGGWMFWFWWVCYVCDWFYLLYWFGCVCVGDLLVDCCVVGGCFVDGGWWWFGIIGEFDVDGWFDWLLCEFDEG